MASVRWRLKWCATSWAWWVRRLRGKSAHPKGRGEIAKENPDFSKENRDFSREKGDFPKKMVMGDFK
jgi:hypothetical protein